ncbi:MAG: T9SS type A sorting domain-containing protein [Cyclobacteriaceae bacterium]|nr:T9SS type A sorting domain-containing protein [Cyclobacteriaceae bacterium]
MKTTNNVRLGFLAGLLLLVVAGRAQQNEKGEIHLTITREIDGVAKTLEKTYANEQEMRDDPEYKEFAGTSHHFVFNFLPDSGEQQMRRWIEMVSHDDGFSQNWKTDIAIEMPDMERIQKDMDNLTVEIRQEMEETQKGLEEIQEKIIVLRNGEENRVRVGNVRVDAVKKEDGFGKKGQVSEGQLLLLEKLDFSPNPSDGKIWLKFELPEEAELSVTIYNKNGKTIYSTYYDGFQGFFRDTLDMGNKEKGNYLLEIRSGIRRLVRSIRIE